MHRDSSKCDVNLCSVVSQVLLGAQEKGTEEIIKKQKNNDIKKISKALKNLKTKITKKMLQKGAAALRQRQQTKRMGEGVEERRSSRGESQYYIYYYICALLLYTERMGGL